MSGTSRNRIGLAIALLLLVPLTGCVAGAGKSKNTYDDLHLESGVWTTTIGLGKPEPDVYIERRGEDGVLRPTAIDAAMPTLRDARLYSSARTQAHDPSFTIVGPFPKGTAIPATLGEWVASSGSWAYACRLGSEGLYQATFTGLVREGLYSLWLERVRLDEGDLEASTWAPLGGSGTSNTFWSNGRGDATVRVGLPECLPLTLLSEHATGIASQVVAIYHSDGTTYGEFPGAFGKNAHVHLTTRVAGGPVT